MNTKACTFKRYICHKINNMLRKIPIILLTLVLVHLSSTMSAQLYEVSYEIEDQDDKQVIEVYMKSGQDTLTRIRAINFSIVYDSTCNTYSSYTCHFSESWTGYLEREGTSSVKDTTKYNGIHYNTRWLFGTAEMINTKEIDLPLKSEEPVHVLTITMNKLCPDASIYLEDEAEYRVNQMGDINLRPAPWVIIR